MVGDRGQIPQFYGFKIDRRPLKILILNMSYSRILMLKHCVVAVQIPILFHIKFNYAIGNCLISSIMALEITRTLALFLFFMQGFENTQTIIYNDVIRNYGSDMSEAVFWRFSVKKGVLKNFSKFLGKHLCRSLFLILKIFSCEFCEIFKNSYF